MKLTCLGRYGPYPAPQGRTTSYLLQTGAGNIVLDFGSGALSHLLEFIGIDQVDAIVLSHLHADHVSDMRVLAYMLNPLVQSGKREKLKVYLPDSPARDFDEIASQAAFEAVAINPDKRVLIGDAIIRFQKTTHAVLCYAMRIESGGSVFAYSADSIYDQTLIPFVQNADLFLCDAAFSTKNQPQNAPHMNGEEAARIAKAAGVKRLVLSHLNPSTDEQALLTEARAVFEKTQMAMEHESVEL